jgi:hypothetical protein
MRLEKDTIWKRFEDFLNFKVFCKKLHILSGGQACYAYLRYARFDRIIGVMTILLGYWKILSIYFQNY